MPMDFPDFKSLIRHAERRKFRAPKPGEDEHDYRQALAAFIRPTDMIEALEIMDGRGWDRQNPDVMAITMLGMLAK